MTRETNGMRESLKLLENDGYFSQLDSDRLRKKAVRLLLRIEEEPLSYLILDDTTSVSVDLLLEKIVRGYLALRQQGYTNAFCVCCQLSIGVEPEDIVGLTDEMLCVLANPGNVKMLDALKTDRDKNQKYMYSNIVHSKYLAGNFEKRCWLYDDFCHHLEKISAKTKFIATIKTDHVNLLHMLEQGQFTLTETDLVEIFRELPANPVSEANIKLTVLRDKNMLPAVNNALSDNSGHWLIQHFKFIIQKNKKTAALNWADVLANTPIEQFSVERIVEEVVLSSQNKLNLEEWSEEKQVEAIYFLKKHGRTDFEVSSLEFYSLLKKSSVRHCMILIEALLFESNNNYVTNDPSNISRLAFLMLQDTTPLTAEAREQVSEIIRQSFAWCIPSIHRTQYRHLKETDSIYIAWKAAKHFFIKTSADEVYVEVQKIRESYPVNHTLIAQKLSDYMRRKPENAFSRNLQSTFGDLFFILASSCPSQIPLLRREIIPDRTFLCC